MSVATTANAMDVCLFMGERPRWDRDTGRFLREGLYAEASPVTHVLAAAPVLPIGYFGKAKWASVLLVSFWVGGIVSYCLGAY